MEKLGLNEIRNRYLAFFEGKGHLRLPSFSLVPEHDKSLLLINAGMAPLKPYFTGQATPPAKRMTTCQKCMRTGDIEVVGKTSRHGTFFEMLGNFSFGDYFKKEAIAWAWEFMTDVLKIPMDKLYVSVYLEDDEAFDIWHKEVGVPADRIFRMGKEDNFWELSLGPCGPCSEIYYDRGPQYGGDDFMASVTADEDRYIEVWNLVFTQFNKGEDGSYSKLETTNIDTGMGLDRMAMVMQDVGSLFDVDTMKAVRDAVCNLFGATYGAAEKMDTSIRIITDHARSVTFMISDGVMPSNEGRGYVLRRLLRRAARHGKLLGAKGLFLTKLADVVIENFKGAYPELAEKRDYIHRLIEQEEQRFYETLDSGMEQLRRCVDELTTAGQNVLAGADAFKLHDTYGFPLELTREILEEEGLAVDEAGFKEEMEKQRSRARAAREDAGFMGNAGSVFDGIDVPAAEFVGYCCHAVEDAKILYIAAQSGDDVAVLLDKTPVYAESGGQKADFATIKTATGEVRVTDCMKAGNGQFAHIGKMTGSIEVGQTASISIDAARRLDIARHHTATHLLHHILRQVLGNHVQQAGSLVAHDRLRFDFAHFAAITAEELARIENTVNDAILANLSVDITEKTPGEAKAMGAVALFGEKYGDTVRVVDIGGQAVELCGGTHLTGTAQIGSFKILSESGISAGVRRIEAVVGGAALAHYQSIEAKLGEIAAFLKTPAANVISRVEQLINAAKEAERQLAKMRQADANSAVDEILAGKEEIGGHTLVSAVLQNTEIDALRNLSDILMDKLGGGIVLLAGISGDSGSILARATDDAIKAGVHCGNLVKAAAQAAGGGGGGRPNMAQAGIKDAARVGDALTAAKQAISN
ncbi:MAG: alanine--tRNA ligase [Defluviitaleaceae bacterium]|nr:alanine--tRNA ligase [Defluviitaleaceae bacterium]